MTDPSSFPTGRPEPVTLAARIAASVAALPLPAGAPGARWNPSAVTAAWLRARRSPHTRRAYFRHLAGYLIWLDAAGLDPCDARCGSRYASRQASDDSLQQYGGR